MKRRLTKFIIQLTAIVAVVFVGAFLFILYGIPYSVSSELKQIQCNGIIVSLQKTNPCFMTIEENQKNAIIKFDGNYCNPDNGFFNFISVGDSVKKQAGQLVLVVIKKDSQIKKTFNYPYAIQ